MLDLRKASRERVGFLPEYVQEQRQETLYSWVLHEVRAGILSPNFDYLDERLQYFVYLVSRGFHQGILHEVGRSLQVGVCLRTVRPVDVPHNLPYYVAAYPKKLWVLGANIRQNVSYSQTDELW